jgi:hypothetical protein
MRVAAGMLAVAVACLAAGLCTRNAFAVEQDFDLSVDLRAVSTSTNQRSFLDNGGGKLRFDEQHDGLRLGSVRIGYRGDLTDTLRLSGEAFAYGDHDVHALDLTELLLSWRPVPQSYFRHELKIGAFYPPVSMENRMRGWRTPYSLSNSAINTWIGEEFRTIGAEYNLDWLGLQRGNAWNLGFTAAVFGWNDPAGVIMARRGWALHDRQTALFGRLGQPGTGSPFGPGHGPSDGRILFHRDIDHRAGYYAGTSASYRGVLELRALHYDNRGDPTRQAPEINDAAWLTRFDSFGARWTPDDYWTLQWQHLQGSTAVNAGGAPTSSRWVYDSDYLLASWQRGRHRLTARADRFWMQQRTTSFFFYNYDDGQALTLAWLYQLNPKLTLVAETLRVRSELDFRALIGAPEDAVEHQHQLALRLEF